MNDNTIFHAVNGSVSMRISKEAREKLNAYSPKGCPFIGYTLFDLLTDFVRAYSWIIARGSTESLCSFIRRLQRERYAHAVVYGDDMLRLIEEG